MAEDQGESGQSKPQSLTRRATLWVLAAQQKICRALPARPWKIPAYRIVQNIYRNNDLGEIWPQITASLSLALRNVCVKCWRGGTEASATLNGTVAISP
ncbi:MAG: hypothetical protein ACYCOY_13200, partial [Metallibacterium sp.]